MDVKTKKAKGKEKAKATVQPPSSNWLALQKKISHPLTGGLKKPPKKKRRIEDLEKGEGTSEAGGIQHTSSDNVPSSSFLRGHAQTQAAHEEIPSTILPVPSDGRTRSGLESLEHLRRMVLGQVDYTEAQKEPGKYLALDCEMVGVGIDGAESSLARVSLVNYHGAVVLDAFVRQRERVVDYRTAVSGVRETDTINAIRFLEIQKQVSELLKDRILVGHAVNNDLKALLLSQPRHLVRDTQLCAGKARLLKTKYPALRKLVQQELGVTIQAGEHSSVTDARATMALYRLHRKEWEKGIRMPMLSPSRVLQKKRKAPTEEDDEDDASSGPDEEQDESVSRTCVKQKTTIDVRTSQTKLSKSGTFPGGGRRGVSSGLSTVVKHARGRIKNGKAGGGGASTDAGDGKDKWWATLGGVSVATAGRGGSKGSMRVS
ncbi:hypothetical protein M0805_008211 [Coniferiporia weirii]|nr:hypothetical protein M0805_008211 [Coniferiporia weirii]